MHPNKIRTDSLLFRKLDHMFPDAAFPKNPEKRLGHFLKKRKNKIYTQVVIS